MDFTYCSKNIPNNQPYSINTYDYNGYNNNYWNINNNNNQFMIVGDNKEFNYNLDLFNQLPNNSPSLRKSEPSSINKHLTFNTFQNNGLINQPKYGNNNNFASNNRKALYTSINYHGQKTDYVPKKHKKIKPSTKKYPKNYHQIYNPNNYPLIEEGSYKYDGALDQYPFSTDSFQNFNNYFTSQETINYPITSSENYTQAPSTIIDSNINEINTNPQNAYGEYNNTKNYENYENIINQQKQKNNNTNTNANFDFQSPNNNINYDFSQNNNINNDAQQFSSNQTQNYLKDIFGNDYQDNNINQTVQQNNQYPPSQNTTDVNNTVDKNKDQTNLDTSTNDTINTEINFYFKTIPENCYTLKGGYYFHVTGLHNIGSTCYMNATLQCLMHVSPLIDYFIFVYPKQCQEIKQINKSVETEGKISGAFYGLLKAISAKGIQRKRLNIPLGSNNYLQNKGSFINAVSPEIFQRTVGAYNPLFRNLEANDSKDLILYLLQIMHQELNYYTLRKPFTGYPNQTDKDNTYQTFVASYDVTNRSIISDLFYGTSENTTHCKTCNRVIYNFQKFEFLSFGMYKYNQKEFNLYNGFEDYSKVDVLQGDNQYYCNNCRKLCDADIRTQIYIPPKNLLINLDFGKNKIYMPKTINYDEQIDITRFISNQDEKIIGARYQILGVCSHYGDSGSYGHYIAYCRDKKNKTWYKFNDSMVSTCTKEEIKYGGNPYLLLYERI